MLEQALLATMSLFGNQLFQVLTVRNSYATLEALETQMPDGNNLVERLHGQQFVHGIEQVLLLPGPALPSPFPGATQDVAPPRSIV